MHLTTAVVERDAVLIHTGFEWMTREELEKPKKSSESAVSRRVRGRPFREEMLKSELLSSPLFYQER